MRLFTSRNKNLGDAFEYSQHRRRNVADLIDETLQILESHGGDTAMYHIKRVIPLYTSKKQILFSLPVDAVARQQGRPMSREQGRPVTARGQGDHNVNSKTLFDGRAVTR